MSFSFIGHMVIKGIAVYEKLTIPVDFLCNRINDGNNFAFHAKDEVRTFIFKSCLRGADIRT